MCRPSPPVIRAAPLRRGFPPASSWASNVLALHQALPLPSCLTLSAVLQIMAASKPTHSCIALTPRLLHCLSCTALPRRCRRSSDLERLCAPSWASASHPTSQVRWTERGGPGQGELGRAGRARQSGLVCAAGGAAQEPWHLLAMQQLGWAIQAGLNMCHTPHPVYLPVRASPPLPLPACSRAAGHEWRAGAECAGWRPRGQGRHPGLIAGRVRQVSE